MLLLKIEVRLKRRWRAEDERSGGYTVNARLKIYSMLIDLVVVAPTNQSIL